MLIMQRHSLSKLGLVRTAYLLFRRISGLSVCPGWYILQHGAHHIVKVPRPYLVGAEDRAAPTDATELNRHLVGSIGCW